MLAPKGVPVCGRGQATIAGATQPGAGTAPSSPSPDLFYLDNCRRMLSEEQHSPRPDRLAATYFLRQIRRFAAQTESAVGSR